MTDKELLDNAVDVILNVYKDDDYFCSVLCEIPEEEKLCAETCTCPTKDCVLRFLKYYKKDE